jgi:hypothetical protein
MVERDRRGQELARPFPLARRWVRVGLLIGGLALLAFVPRSSLPIALAGVAVAVLVLPPLLVPTPYPAFLTIGRRQAYELEPRSWLRLRDGSAVQAMNVHIRMPDTTGDPTPPQVIVRCSDDVTRTYRPQDALHVVQPVDLRFSRRSAG